MNANGKLYVVGAEFKERFCRPTKMLEKGAEATSLQLTVLQYTNCYKQLIKNCLQLILCLVTKSCVQASFFV